MFKPLPKKYEFLRAEKGPRILIEALKFHGLEEIQGLKNNAEIMNWARDVDARHVYNADEIPWCGLFMAKVCFDSQIHALRGKDCLWARNWAKFGNKAETPMLGDIMVFSRGKSSGHVGIYVGESKTTYHVLGGNQSDSVSIVEILKTRLIDARRPIWKIGQPVNVRQIFLDKAGPVSTNES